MLYAKVRIIWDMAMKNHIKNTKKCKFSSFLHHRSPSQSKSGRHPKTSTAFSALSDRFYIVVRIAVFLLNISICNAIIGLKILIFSASGLQIPMSITPFHPNSKED